MKIKTDDEYDKRLNNWQYFFGKLSCMEQMVDVLLKWLICRIHIGMHILFTAVLWQVVRG